MKYRRISLSVFACVLAATAMAQDGGNDQIAALKQSLQKGLAAIRSYEWVETTVISVKGDEKARTQNSCMYGSDGKVHKSPMGAPPEGGKKPRGLRGKIAEKKKGEMTEAMQEAVGLVKQYIPPDPERIQAAKAAGNVSVSPPDGNGIIAIVINDYLKPGDSVTIGVNASKNSLESMAVATFTNKEKNTVDLDVALGTLADGAIYPSKIDLAVASENLDVAIENTDHKKAG